MLSRPLPTPVSSGAHTSRRATGLSLRHLPATRGASARRGATAQTVWQAFADWSPVCKQSSGGSPPNKPRQRNLTGGADQPEDPSAKQGWWQAAIRAVLQSWPFILSVAALLASVVGVITWCSGFATTAALEGAEKRITTNVKDSEGRLNEKVAAVQTSVKDSEDRVQKSVKASEDRVQKSVDEVKKSMGNLQILVIVQVLLGAFLAGTVYNNSKNNGNNGNT